MQKMFVEMFSNTNLAGSHARQVKTYFEKHCHQQVFSFLCLSATQLHQSARNLYVTIYRNIHPHEPFLELSHYE